MKLGVLTVLFGEKSLEETLVYLKSLGIDTVEIGCGGYPGTAHANAREMAADQKKLDAFRSVIDRHGFSISALSVHGNPVHPNKTIAEGYRRDFEAAVAVAEKLGVDTVITFSGCPGDSENAKYPNWITCPWPNDFSELLQWQWNEVLIPYWKEAAAFARSHKVTKLALEMHPGFCVYNPETLLKLRSAVGPEIGANFDPSHLIWQGIDPAAAIRELKGAIFHFHAKDSRVDKYNCLRNGVLDTKVYTNEAERSWIFRTVGYGSDTQVWKDMFSALSLVGYDYVISIEHEDSLMTPTEGLKKAIDFLRQVMIFEGRPRNVWWV